MADQEQIIRQLSDELADMRRRLTALETAPRANQTAVRNGHTTWYLGDTDVLPAMTIGATDDGLDLGYIVKTESGDASYLGTSAGGTDAVLVVRGDSPRVLVEGDNPSLSVGASDGTQVYALRIVDGEMYAPLITAAWQGDPFVTRDGFGRPQTNSGSYTTLYRTWLPITGDQVATQIYAVLGAGVTSIDVRISARIANTSDPFVTVATYSGLTADGYLNTPIWTVPSGVSPTTFVIGLLCEFVVEARVVGGAGFAQIGAWAPLANWPA